MNFEFKKIDKEGFIRIWNSDYEDAFVDSRTTLFDDSSEDEWKASFRKQLKVMNEVVINGSICGYIFLSPKDDGNAHLGYGLYKDFRGKGYSIEMCRQFLHISIPNLDKSIIQILGTTLEDNVVSQVVLKKLGFQFLEKVDDPELDYLRFKRNLDLP